MTNIQPRDIPDMFVFRLPDDENTGEKVFIEGSIVDGFPQSDFSYFTISKEDAPDDSYHDMKFTNVILAMRVPGGSLDVTRFELLDDDNSPVTVHDRPGLQGIIAFLFNEYMTGKAD